jgi:hypothetical protein
LSVTPSLTPTRTITLTPTPSRLGKCYTLNNIYGEAPDECYFSYQQYGVGTSFVTVQAEGSNSEGVCTTPGTVPTISGCTTGECSTYCTVTPCTSTINCTSGGSCSGCT